MTVEVVEKRKVTRVCGDCGHELAADVSKGAGCPECNSENIKKRTNSIFPTMKLRMTKRTTLMKKRLSMRKKMKRTTKKRKKTTPRLLA
jgi:anaerobic ribonucleoside-triphosphate reductase